MFLFVLMMVRVLAKHEVAEWEEVARLDETERKGGFGHTGEK